MRSPVKWVERSKTKTRTDGQRPRTALRRPAIQCSGGIALNPPARIPGRLTSGGLVGSARIAPSDSLRPAVWPVYHIPADKLLTCFDNFRMPTDLRELLAIVRQSLAGVRTTLYSRSRSATRAGLAGYLFETAHNAIAPIWHPGAYIRSRELGSVVEGAHSDYAHEAKGWLEHEIRHAAETREHNRSSGIARPDARMTLRVAERLQPKRRGSAMLKMSTAGLGRPS